MSEENNIYTPDFENEQSNNANEAAPAHEIPLQQEVKQDEVNEVKQETKQEETAPAAEEPKVRFCDQCGAKITSANAKFCAECGNKLF